MKKSEALQQRKDLIRLITEWTRAEIISRFGRFDNLEFADYFRIKIEKEDEIRQLLFGSSELVVLGKQWGLVKDKPTRRKRKTRGKKKT